MTVIELYGISFDIQPTKVLATGLVGLAVYLLYKKSRRPHGFPPGPFRLPLIGTPTAFINPEKFIEFFGQMRAKYGDMYSIYLGPMPMVFICNYSLIKEAFITKGLNTSGRPIAPQRVAVFPKYPHIQGIIDTSLCEEWKKQRSTSLTILRDQGWGKGILEHSIRRECHLVVEELKKAGGKPQDPAKLLGISVSNIMCSMLFGKHYDYDDEEFKALLEDIDGYFDICGGDSNYMEVPILRWLPGTRRAVKEMYRYGSNLMWFYEKKIAEAESKLNNGEEPSDFVTNYIAEVRKIDKGKANISQEWTLPLIHDFFIAGTDTTATTMRWAILYMAKYPDVQRKVQAEIDSVFGKGAHDFCLKDREKLSYTDATIMEIQRHSSMVLGSLPHLTNKEIQIGGYTIPKDTIICGLIYCVMHEPKVWGDPENFRPDRFIDEDGKVFRPDELIPFMIGRRACLGEQLAKNELFLFFTYIMNTFTISPPEDAPELIMERRMAFLAKPYSDQPLSFKPRF